MNNSGQLEFLLTEGLSEFCLSIFFGLHVVEATLWLAVIDLGECSTRKLENIHL